MEIDLKLPESFFSPEERCGFYVNEKRKKIWAVELDLLKVFSDVCEKNDLHYFMDGGTLLGAIRHKGFIPWDDDVDVIMPRKDYDRLMEIADQEFKPPYVLQTSLNTEGFFRTHAQLRNGSTTGFIAADAKKENANKGIWLDVFVLDKVTDRYFARKRQRKKIFRIKELLKMKYDVKPNRKAINYYKNHSFEDLFISFNRNALGAYQDKKAKRAGNLTLRWKEKWIWPLVYFQNYCYLPFENLTLGAPLFYCEVMRKQYGENYMEYPENYKEFPIEPGCPAGVSTHGGAFFDPDKPYTEYDMNSFVQN